MRKLALGCLVIAGVAVFSVFSVAKYALRELPMLESELTAPSMVTLDEPITLVVTATNKNQEAVTLDSIDVDNAFLSGFQVLEVNPEPTESSDIPLLDQRTWAFGRSIPPGGQVAVAFKLKPVQTGHFVGDIDVCNPTQDFSTVYADIVVRE
jgi:hypothetical protein